VIRQQRATPQHPNVAVQWMEHEDVTDGDERPPVPPHRVDTDEDVRLGQRYPHHQGVGSQLNVSWPKDNSSSQSSSRRSSGVLYYAVVCHCQPVA
jgi:hypothetical protein